MIKPLVGIIAILLISSASVAGSQKCILFLECHFLYARKKSYYYQKEILTGSLFLYQRSHSCSFYAHSICMLIAVLAAIWAIRLGSFLLLRVKKAGQDRRFDKRFSFYLHGHLAVLGCLSPWQQH